MSSPPFSPEKLEHAAGARVSHPVIGQRVGGVYQITGFIAEGPVAQVFTAVRDSAPRHVALKVMLPAFANYPGAAQRFLTAAEKATSLDHPGIVAVFGSGEDRGWRYVASEMVLGENLASYVQTRGALAPHDALRIALDVTRAAAHALTRGVLHGGLRPSNVLITRSPTAPELETVRVADFGMAEIVADARPLDGFASPELAQGSTTEPASDVYGIGALLHLALTGLPPFADLQGEALRDAIRCKTAPAPANVDALGPHLVALLDRLLRKQPRERFPSVKELAVVLSALLSSREATGGGVPHPASWGEPSTLEDQTQTTLRPAARASAGAGAAHEHALVGQVLDDRFRVVSFMRSGGMAQLYFGTQPSEPRQVAIKVVHPELAAEPEIVRRFAREARLAATLSHPNIVELVHVGADPELLYIAMEMLEGEDLAVRIKQRGRFAEAQAASIALQVTHALSHAHALGVVHRDIKPANIMMCKGQLGDEVKLLDFGIAKVLEKDAHALHDGGLTMTRSAITVVGDLVGTPRYMSPEQARALPVDHRADLYSLGIVLYELVTGAVPFNAETPLLIVARQAQDRPRPPSELTPELHPRLERLILDLLKKDPRDRPASAAEVRHRLEALLPELAVSPATSTHRFMRGPPPRPELPNSIERAVEIDSEPLGVRDDELPTKSNKIERGVLQPASPKQVSLHTVPMRASRVLTPSVAIAEAAAPSRATQPTVNARSGTARMVRKQVLDAAQPFMAVAHPAPAAPSATQSAPAEAPPKAPSLADQIARLSRLIQILVAVIVALAIGAALILLRR